MKLINAGGHSRTFTINLVITGILLVRLRPSVTSSRIVMAASVSLVTMLGMHEC